jgi:DNA-directed RNA polymerase specialized sigma24 family protein
VPSRRQNRAGAREGIISAELEAALLNESHALGGLVEAVDRIKAVNDFFAKMDLELEQFADVRLEAVTELRAQGWSYDRIAEATELSKARVAQLVKETRRA